MSVMSATIGQLSDDLVLSDVHLNHSFTTTGKGNFGMPANNFVGIL